ncbi:MAG: amino acid permease, partial [Sphingomonadales bacterium]|nr:amino acid permease [Sphingomonadales bacterium]
MLKSGGELKRALSTPVLMAYGVGTILGAGIYALIGKISGMAGYLTPLAFLAAAFIAFLTALSYAELGSRFPKAAGEAIYVFEGFSSKHLGALAGFLVIISGVVSSAALAVGFMGYFGELMNVPAPLVLFGVVLVLGGIATIGVIEAVWLVVGVTVIEVAGLVYILAVGWDGVGLYFENVSHYVDTMDGLPIFGLFSGMILSIYAYIGFEDMANMAEETKEPRKALGVAILGALLITTVLYLLVSMVSLGHLTPDEL